MKIAAARIEMFGAFLVVGLLIWTTLSFVSAWWTNRQLWELQDLLRSSACVTIPINAIDLKTTRP